MSSLLSAHNLSKSFATQHLFDDISFSICQGDRIGLIGPNGCGKSTLLKILLQLEPADKGTISKRQGLLIGYGDQAPEFKPLPVEEVMISGIKGDETTLLTRARMLLTKAQFSDTMINASTLSGGWKKRLSIAQAMMREPDLLLLDEPTNHLDLEGILWLEKFLQRERVTTLIVSHDRYFLSNVCKQIMELNRCYPEGLFTCESGLTEFYVQKQAFLEGQLERQRSLAGVVRDEIDWLRRSPKARTSKSKARIQKAHTLIEDLQQVSQRNKVHKLEMEFSASERETRNLLVATNLSKSMGTRQLFQGLEIKLSPGTRLGIVGRNGTGKTTLLKVLAGAIPFDGGTLKCAEGLKLVYFDQHREQIPLNITLKEALSPNGDTVNYRGQPMHVNGWAKRFLFSSERLNMPIKYLSGGERARIQIARLMLQPADVLFLDEPTNDLDITTLEIIEESLCDFPGAVVLISHDRCLMDRLCTQILGLGTNNPEFYADYAQWEQTLLETPQKSKPAAVASPTQACATQASGTQAGAKQTSNVQSPTPASAAKPGSNPLRPSGLDSKEKRELHGIEAAIAATEVALEKTSKKLQETPSTPSSQMGIYHELADIQRKHDELFERWQYLLNKQSS